MISNARGNHSSPGVYIEEIDKTYATRSLGITTLGVAGETLKGPAFEPISISDWSEFQDYFGGTSTEKFKATQYPKYELPYIAKSYLKESKQLQVCRVLGLSGYDAGKAWLLYATKEGSASTKTVIGVLRSKASYTKSEGGDVCNPNNEYDVLKPSVSEITMSAYTSVEGIINGCNATVSSTKDSLTVSPKNYGRFSLEISLTDGTTETASVSLNPGEKDYIIDVLGVKADDGDFSVFVEDLYDMAFIDGVDKREFDTIGLSAAVEDISDYREMYRYASTPWFVSELKGNGSKLDIKKLFRFHTISDGNAANSQIKVSIANVCPDAGTFDVLIRDYYDTDNSQLVLEKFTKCTMMPGDTNYIGLRIGTFNGDYASKSKYVTVEVIENDMTASCVPCGFLGYPLRKYNGYEAIKPAYNTRLDNDLKINRQYFGMSDLVGVDLDMLSYKGVEAYDATQHPSFGYSHGFHMDSILNEVKFTVDGKTGYTFVTVDQKQLDIPESGAGVPRIGRESLMENSIYADKKTRKFTCYPYGGFDGWDIYRDSRSNTSEFRANKYKGALGEDKPFSTDFDGSALGLSGRVITSDYYAYLAAYKQFENPQKIKINILATPGIDYVNNLDLVNEVLDIVEEYRQGDCIYIVTTPDKAAGNGDGVDEMYTPQDVVSNFEASEISTSYAATYYPWVKYYDEANKKYINLPATKDVVRNFAYTDNVAHPWFASAGMTRGNVECTKAHYFTKLSDEDTLYEAMINPIKSFGTDGVKIWGNKTMYLEDTPLNRINVRRLMIRIKDLVVTAARQLIFEQNDNTVDAQFRSIVEPILANAKQNRGISDYKIKTDTSAEARDRHELPAKIWIKPINCLEYIPISFVVTPEGANFDE